MIENKKKTIGCKASHITKAARDWINVIRKTITGLMKFVIVFLPKDFEAVTSAEFYFLKAITEVKLFIDVMRLLQKISNFSRTKKN